MNPDLRCEDVLRYLPAYLANELAAPVSDDVAAHLATCPECAMELATERRLDQLVTRAVDDAAPSDIAVRQRVRDSIAVPAPRRAYWWRFAPLAATLAALIVGIGAWRGIDAYRTQVLCTDAADDHQTEIVDKQPRRWRATPQEISALARQELGTPELPQAIEGEHLALARARICRLRGQRFMHLVYAGGGREVSVFLSLAKPGVRMNSGAAPGAIHEQRHDRSDVATFDVGNLVVVVASDVAANISVPVANELAHTF